MAVDEITDGMNVKVVLRNSEIESLRFQETKNTTEMENHQKSSGWRTMYETVHTCCMLYCMAFVAYFQIKNKAYCEGMINYVKFSC